MRVELPPQATGQNHLLPDLGELASETTTAPYRLINSPQGGQRREREIENGGRTTRLSSATRLLFVFSFGESKRCRPSDLYSLKRLACSLNARERNRSDLRDSEGDASLIFTLCPVQESHRSSSRPFTSQIGRVRLRRAWNHERERRLGLRKPSRGLSRRRDELD